MFGLIGLVFGLVFGTSKFALHNAVRIAAFGLVGYLVYELVLGYSHGKAGLPAPEVPEEAPAAATTDRAPLTGASKRGRTVRVSDASGIEHATRVGRGVVRR